MEMTEKKPARRTSSAVQGTSKNVVFSLDKLVSDALKEKHSGAVLIRTSNYDASLDNFEKLLVRSARITTSGDPTEVSKILVDVNEKVYENRGNGEKGDETKVTIVKKSENSEAYSYEQQTTSGLQWDAKINLGVQFGLPQVGGLKFGGSGLKFGGSGGLNAGFNKHSENFMKDSSAKTATQESHHEETVEIPAGHKVTVKMTSYRVRYKLEYAMKYKVSKTASVLVRYNSFCGLCSRSSGLTAAQILSKMPNFKNDPRERHVEFTQNGVLTWVADRMVVVKDVTPLSVI